MISYCRYIVHGFLFLIFIFLFSCKDDEGTNSFSDQFERRELLSNWADNIIIPSFKNYQVTLIALNQSMIDFSADSTEANFDALTSMWLMAYKAWQKVAFFDIGKTEEIGLRNFTNIYPTDVMLIVNNIEGEDYNLDLPSNFDAQGFPALDYLFFGLGDSKMERIQLLSTQNYNAYLEDLVTRLLSKTNEVVDAWEGSYRDEFVDNDGSSATASVDKLVNDFLFHYEKYLRAGKIGIPAGVFSGSPIDSAVEAPFSGIYSKDLLVEGFSALIAFFRGQEFIGAANKIGLDDYLEYIMEQIDSADINQDIENQWATITAKIDLLLPSFKEQIVEDNNKMLETYDELQKSVILLKVDMMQALNIQVDYVDADGD